jgi:hypothetical protein
METDQCHPTLDYLFRNLSLIDIETNHHLMLKKLLTYPVVVKALLNLEVHEPVVEREPNKGKFDLLVKEVDKERAFIEVKVWNDLKSKQLTQQKEFIDDREAKSYHLLIGPTSLEYDRGILWGKYQTTMLTAKDLWTAIDVLLKQPPSDDPFLPIAKAYREVLESQYLKWRNAWLDKNSTSVPNRVFYFSFFGDLKKQLSDSSLRIIAGRYGNGILQDHQSYNLKSKDFEGTLRLEIVNHDMMIRLHQKGKAQDRRYLIRDQLIEALKVLIDRKYAKMTKWNDRMSTNMKIVRLSLEKLDLKRKDGAYNKKHKEIILKRIADALIDFRSALGKMNLEDADLFPIP